MWLAESSGSRSLTRLHPGAEQDDSHLQIDWGWICFQSSLVGVGRIRFLMGGQTESFDSPMTVDPRWFLVLSRRADHSMVAAS